MTTLHELTPAAEQGWGTLFDLGEVDSNSWLLIGGQMMYLLATEGGAALPRPTDDVDVVVDVRARPGGTEWLAGWLGQQGFDLDGISTDGIGHRFARQASPGPGRVVFDVLALEGLGERTRVFTKRPARTVQTPGSQQAFARSELVEVTVSGVLGGPERSGTVRRPNMLGALVIKAAATTIPVRSNPMRDWQDAALLLSLLQDPVAASAECGPKDRKRLRMLLPLLDRDHHGWAPLDTSAYRAGSTALEFLLDERPVQTRRPPPQS
jgi:hypothetical protein